MAKRLREHQLDESQRERKGKVVKKFKDKEKNSNKTKRNEKYNQ